MEKKGTKKLVDLIYLDQKKQIADLENEYRARIAVWTEWMDRKLDKIVDEDIYIEEQSEYFMANNFLRNFLIKRFEWILNSVPNDDIKAKYLLALPPFNQSGNIKSFLVHFFQFKDSQTKNTLEFEFLSHSEREVRILWDLYKLTKTLDSIEVIRAAISVVNPFPSIFDRIYIVNLLNTLSGVLSLLIKICVKPEYLDEVLYEFPTHCFEPEDILFRKEAKQYLINDIVLERLDYRNYIFHIFFRSNLKAVHQGEDLSFVFNYLDYEIVRQEFLIHWLYTRLNGNPRKKEILDKYLIGNKSFSEIIATSPGMELYILKQLPKQDFEHLIAEVNDSLEEDRKLPIDPMSEEVGEFAKMLKRFKRAQQLAKKSVTVLKKLIHQAKNRIKPETEEKNRLPVKDTAKISSPSASNIYQLEIVDKAQIDFPFFCVTNSNFSRQLTLLRSRMDPAEFLCFNEYVTEFLLNKKEEALIKRRTPRHEWVIPYLIRETGQSSTMSHLLILGVEAKNQHMSMGYGSGLKEKYDFRSYFVYGSREEQSRLGTPTESRIVKGEKYLIYPLSNIHTVEKALNLVDYVIHGISN